MSIIKSLEGWLAYSYQKIWDDGKIAKRPLWLVILLPSLLSAGGAWLKVYVLDSGTPPFLFFFVVVTLSACFGGIRGAFIGTGFTTLFSLSILLFVEARPEFVMVLGMLQIVLYFFQCLFLTALLHRFHRNEQRCAMQYDEVLKSKEEIQTREKLHEDFVHMATHELKAPVTVLKAYLQLAEMKLKMPENQSDMTRGKPISSFHELVVKMNFQLDKLVSLINDLLESTRIKAGALNCQMSTFDLNRCLNECVEGFKAAHPEAQIDCNLPEGQLLIDGDEVRIEQVILNLLSNAVKYSPGTAKVQVSCEQVEGNAFIRVKDQGMGIPADMLESVFSRFVRVKSPEMSKFSGLGLGLYICAEIIKVHGGEIQVDSILGEGSTFWFSLPIEKLG
jgi:signal transduction histidine kinase